MGDETNIAWTDHTFNPWIGCTKVSAGCANCYAEVLDKRWGHDSWGPGRPRRRTSKANWRKPLAWNKAAEEAGVRRRVFCASLADVFDPEAPPGARGDLWGLVEATPSLDWQILTKRPENVPIMMPATGLPHNVWLGTSVEDQAAAEARIPDLFEVEASVRFLSCEPLLGRVNLADFSDVDWIIVGGESGHGHRPMDLAWARELRDLAHGRGIAFFFKQVGGRFPESNGHLLDGREHHDWPDRTTKGTSGGER